MKIYSCDLVGFHSFNAQVMTDFIFYMGITFGRKKMDCLNKIIVTINIIIFYNFDSVLIWNVDVKGNVIHQEMNE